MHRAVSTRIKTKAGTNNASNASLLLAYTQNMFYLTPCFSVVRDKALLFPA
jgi:hypothetical protein